MNSIVISIGGSVLHSDDVTDSYLKEFIKLIKKFSQKNRIYLVVGGGKPAREYIKRGRFLQLTEHDLDTLGILVTRVNASFLAMLFSDSNQHIPCSVEEAVELKNAIVIMGGTSPGHSTDFVGAELADRIQAEKYIIATNVDGIFDKDPNKFSDATRIPQIDIDSLLSQYGSTWDSAGSNVVVDGPALQKIADAGIETVVVNGKKLSELQKVLCNKDFLGTRIQIK